MKGPYTPNNGYVRRASVLVDQIAYYRVQHAVHVSAAQYV